MLAKSFGFSRTFNTRNIEFFWYSLLLHALVDLTSDLPGLLIFPQFPAYVNEEFYATHLQGDIEGDEDRGIENIEGFDVALNLDHNIQLARDIEGDEDNILENLEGFDALNLDDQVAPETLDDEIDTFLNNPEQDFSTASMHTIPARKAKGVLTDYALIYTLTKEDPKGHSARYGGIRITRAKVTLIVEQKRFCSRSLDTAAAEKAMTRLLAMAQQQASDQAAYFFIQYPDTKEIIALAVCGPFWRNATLTPAHVAQRIAEIKRDPNANLVLETPEVWRRALRLDLKDSRNRFGQIHEELALLATWGPGET
ncbi:hypothetical protein BJ138DRAFT_1107629 [Hygrophoropsis aurantiaca]|uniref:Uncharacterized protein n=1 Tax=Hygrophoropsis aurantiaca TaxID=72124 RepID=A0ACB7ZRQ1_9AGAM|nr:hypothetical protein BJ138DRAFT_1107629 [Hygrophoropsis aurantiaca]